GSQGDQLRLRDVPADSTMLVQFRFALGVGDYDRNGIVDSLDYDLWANTLGSTADLMADGNFDGVIDAADYTIWRDAFDAPPAVQTSVPEPTSFYLLSLLLAAA
ncbi:unnamed protein product, partial [Ectocarpus sp. 4 AP-2014]